MRYYVDPRFAREHVNLTTDELYHLSQYEAEFTPQPVWTPTPVPKRRRSLRFRIAIALLAVVALIIGSGVVIIGSLRFRTPDETAFMAANQPDVIHQWVGIDHISRYPIAAAIVLEDSGFLNRDGAFDVEAFIGTALAYLQGQTGIDGGSTIHQQLTKNMWLNGERSAGRKAVEAAMSMPLAWTVPKKRVLELYLNYAQLGPNIYGICAASWYYFGSPPWNLDQHQATQMMAVLPMPSLARRAPGGGVYVAPGNPETEAAFNYKVFNRAPADIDFLGGYRPIMDSVGIFDDASDYTHVGEDSCDQMPEGIKVLRLIEGS